ncbi:putative porin [Pseudomonas matsuisoli]|uniref:Porin n=1 Tax=Pseudomonas matsuisoli TaxID=1515666 RepID=A0A917PKY6_9PSED|nr:putative porin [Pseudomonas matsuisoli]GGJ82987.1 hypothetical protein GCM10009304_06290 [Pseudomonas matsuisoli]
MRVVSLSSAISLALLTTFSVTANAAVDQKLLDMLRANGSINQAQHAELTADLANETKAATTSGQVTREEMSALEKKLAWAAKTQFKGDIRLRHERVDVDGEGRAEDRQRIRARLGAYSEVTPQVDAGIRIATGSSDDGRSTNQSLDGYFEKKDLWLDQAYVDYHPDALPGLNLIGGKMSQPWESMGDIIWDGDLNPEGAAATYSHDLGGAELFGSTGYYVLDDGVDANGVQTRYDLSMYTGQAGVKFGLGEAVKLTLGGSVYAFNNDNDASSLNDDGTLTVFEALGNTEDEFELYEAFAKADITGFVLPLSVYGQYVKNDKASEYDTAWLAGFKTKWNALSFDYNYRDVQRNGVVSALTDSDFGGGTTGSRGHKFKLGYALDKNIGVGLTYLMAQSDTYGPETDADVNTLQVDLEAKF